MERIIYDRMAEHDSCHWWYLARRRILAKLIASRISLPSDARILEIGCGTGHNLAMLGQFGRVDAIEIDPAARAVAAQRLGRPVADACLPALDGIAAESYDLIAILDVLEHVEKDREALSAIAARLRPGGRILITVPAFPSMWSGHDTANHHFRRYTRRTLSLVVADAGLSLDMLSWFNSLLFPLAVGARLFAKAIGREGSDDVLPPAPVNRLFEAIFGLERHLIARMPLPPGLSLVAVVSVRGAI
ncbi:class I SAM-dependent methyltransferase [Sphingomonas cavernae]|uniref:Class I SAM-dependent methyltransferase n=1 Tax=Sphingomonas cavernae TaxID=2320861 RepID=A0A418WR22_9SPHN|nr:class I SAM-dependent methyltransferase [Sphingomonas cavernae]RJF93692.1 class I SAM-dependent methyltransferase [Sphingomonas cavernae]